MILLYILQYKRRESTLKKSNQHTSLFNEYDEYNGFTKDIDWSKYRIGDSIIHRGNTEWAYKAKTFYIRSWCIECQDPSKEKIKNEYFSNFGYYQCNSCWYDANSPRIGVRCSSGYKICYNCYERMLFDEKNNICNNCLDVSIFYLEIKNPKIKKIKINCKLCNIYKNKCKYHGTEYQKKTII